MHLTTKLTDRFSPPLVRLVDRVRPPTPDLTAAREAHLALWDHGDATDAAGVREETPEFLALNRAAHDSVAGRGWWFDWRAWYGAELLVERRARERLPR